MMHRGDRAEPRTNQVQGSSSISIKKLKAQKDMYDIKGMLEKLGKHPKSPTTFMLPNITKNVYAIPSMGVRCF